MGIRSRSIVFLTVAAAFGLLIYEALTVSHAHGQTNPGDPDTDTGSMPAEAQARTDVVSAPPEPRPVTDGRRYRSPIPFAHSRPSRRPPRYWCRA